MIRFIILVGYFELSMYLQLSGKLDQYINTHYAYLAYISMVLSFVLAIVQLVIWVKNMKLHSHLQGKLAKFASPIILAIPVLVGLLIPTVTLDSTTVSAKGYHFPLAAGSAGTVSEDGTTVQYLKPDTSLYFTSSAYKKEMQKELKQYEGTGPVKITTDNYMEVMELIYVYPDALTLVLVHLHIQAKLRHSTDGSFEDFSQAVLHVFHLLVLYAGALGLCCRLFHLAAVRTQFLILVPSYTSSTLGIASQQTVNHQVGITSDGACEMGVVAEGQTIVSHILYAVLGFHHGTQAHHLHHVLFLLAFDIVEQLVEIAAYIVFGAVGAQLIAELAHEIGQIHQLLWVRCVVDTIHKDLGLGSLAYPANAFGLSFFVVKFN